MRRFICLAAVAFIVGSTPVSAAAAENIWYSVFVPGLGQIESGHYGRGSLFLGAELASLSALGIIHLQYDRTVDQYNRAKAEYLNARFIGDAQTSFVLMHQKWNDANKLYRWQTAATAAAIGVWAVNVVDMALFDRKDDRPLLSMEMKPGGFLVLGTVSF
jgi:hypothetical protein